MKEDVFTGKISFIQLAQPEAREVFKMWEAKTDKKLY